MKEGMKIRDIYYKANGNCVVGFEDEKGKEIKKEIKNKKRR